MRNKLVLSLIVLLLFAINEKLAAQTHRIRIESSKLLTTNHVISTHEHEKVRPKFDLNNGYNSAFMFDFNTEKRVGWSIGLSVKKQSVKIVGYEAYNITTDPDGNVNIDGVYKFYDGSFFYNTFSLSGNLALVSREKFKLRFELGFGVDFLFFTRKDGFFNYENGYNGDYQMFNLNSFASVNFEHLFLNGWTLGLKLPYVTTALTPNYEYEKTYDSPSTLKQYFRSFGIGCYLTIPRKSKQ